MSAIVSDQLSTSEQNALNVFRTFRVSSGEMLCFYGPDLKKHKPALSALVRKGVLVAERFTGGYSLTASGVRVMQASA